MRLDHLTLFEDNESYGKCPACGESAMLYKNLGGTCADCGIAGREPPSETKCARCGAETGGGMRMGSHNEKTGETEESTVCASCALREFGFPGLAKDVDCRECYRPIDDVPLALTTGGQTTYYHDECLREWFKSHGCPKCRSKGGFYGDDMNCRCGAWSFKRFAEKAQSDAIAILANPKGKTCSQCLAFNSATAMGLPFYPHDPNPAEAACSMCGGAICDIHTYTVQKNNVLGLEPGRLICTGAWTSSCYSKLEDKVACAHENCDAAKNSTSRHRKHDDWDALKDSVSCDCGNWMCGDEHDQCPDCVGIACDRCGENTPQDELSSLEGDYSAWPDKFCDDCRSNLTCGSCGQQLSDEEAGDMPSDEHEWAGPKFGGYCEECSVEEGQSWRCADCNETLYCGEYAEDCPELEEWVTAYKISDGEYTDNPNDGEEVSLCPDCKHNLQTDDPKTWDDDPNQQHFRDPPDPEVDEKYRDQMRRRWTYGR